MSTAAKASAALAVNTRRFASIGADRLIALSVALGCCAVLGEAYTRTDLADAELPSSCSFGLSGDLLTEGRVRALEKDGMVVIPGALSEVALLAARKDIERYRSLTDFERHGNDDDVRQDMIAWVRPPAMESGTNHGNTGVDLMGSSAVEDEGNDAGKDGLRPNLAHNPIGRDLAHCIDLIRGVAFALETWDYSRSSSHRVPLQCQLALYRGDRKSGYARHLDRCRATLEDLGVMEWLRLSDYRSRAVTAILYLNDPGRTPADGGALRCWLRTDNEGDRDCSNDTGNHKQDDESKGGTFAPPIDVQPTGGTLLIFDSDRLEHMVLPSSKDRYALTVWVSGEQGKFS
mmetsp:Transcript_3450/g.8995  ORF Transcript_3450/g.8995 Transcript_3450/m.8995 type:complete len:346 (-) Transcript_3450:49-1086(-)